MKKINVCLLIIIVLLGTNVFLFLKWKNTSKINSKYDFVESTYRSVIEILKKDKKYWLIEQVGINNYEINTSSKEDIIETSQYAFNEILKQENKINGFNDIYNINEINVYYDNYGYNCIIVGVIDSNISEFWPTLFVNMKTGKIIAAFWG